VGAVWQNRPAVGSRRATLQNDNDDIGFVRTIDQDLGNVTVECDGRPVLCGALELDQVVLACATTVRGSREVRRWSKPGNGWPRAPRRVPASLSHTDTPCRPRTLTPSSKASKLVQDEDPAGSQAREVELERPGAR
jgi:hypothetical protein